MTTDNTVLAIKQAYIMGLDTIKSIIENLISDINNGEMDETFKKVVENLEKAERGEI